MNRADISPLIQAQLGDTDAAVWTVLEINDYLQEAYDDFAMRSNIFWVREQLNDVQSVATYVLPPAFIQMDRVEKNYYAIFPSTSRQQTKINGYFKQVEGRPYTYLLEDEGPATLRKIPIPSEAATDFFIEYFKKGTPLTNDLVELECPTRYVKYLMYYVLSKCFERDGDGQDLALAEFWMTLYATGIEMVQARRARYFAQRVGRLGGDDPRNDRLAAPGSLPPYFPLPNPR